MHQRGFCLANGPPRRKDAHMPVPTNTGRAVEGFQGIGPDGGCTNPLTSIANDGIRFAVLHCYSAQDPKRECSSKLPISIGLPEVARGSGSTNRPVTLAP